MRETARSDDAEAKAEDTAGPAPVNKNRLQFESLLANLSARFVNISSDQVDREIQRALEQVLEFFQVDRCGLIAISPDRKRLHLTHASYGEGVELVSGDIDLAGLFPWTERLVLQGQPVRIERLEELPESAGKDRSNCTAMGIRSYLNIPLFFQNKVSSLIVLNAMRRERSWPEEYVPRLRLLGQIFMNALEHRRSRQQLEERLRFEELLSDLSARFVNIPAHQIDDEIEEAQRQICEGLGLDRSTLWQWSADSARLLMLTHIYRRLEGPPIPERLYADDYLPWTVAQLLEGKTVIIPSVEDLPPEAARDKEFLRHHGTKSSLIVPLSVGGGRPMGAVTFATVLEGRAWPEAVLKRLYLVAQIFANALARKFADEALRESEARLCLASESAEMGLWILDIPSGLFWATPKALELFEFPPNEVLSFERFMKAVHAEDRDKIQRTVDDARNSRKNISVEYRAVLPDGSVRWILSRGRPRVRGDEEVEHLMGVSVDITGRKRMEQELQARLAEIEGMKLQLEEENLCLREGIRQDRGIGKIVGSSDVLHYVLFRVGQVAPTDSTVLILGETGTGKGMVAKAIHSLSSRRDRPMITVNCAVLPANLIESELFGRGKGAFTGAQASQIGRFQLADKGTIFLDEIAELPVELQAKLLKVIESGEFERLGDPHTVKVDVRIIASTNRNLDEEIRKGRFREDLFYRLNVFPITVPPLRQRTEDIPLIVDTLIERLNKQMGRHIATVPREVMQALQGYSWPGNVRELENVIERSVIMSGGQVLQLAEQLGAVSPSTAEVPETTPFCLMDVERSHIQRTLETLKWKIEGPTGAAQALGLKPSTLRTRMKKLNIRRLGAS